MMTTTIAKRFRFEASHQLTSLPPNHRCSRLHGHSYGVEITLTGPLDEHGMVIDYGDLAPFREVVETLDHRHLNERLPGVEPTAENLAAFLFQSAELIWPPTPRSAVRVVAVRVAETDGTSAEVRQLELGLTDPEPPR